MPGPLQSHEAVHHSAVQRLEMILEESQRWHLGFRDPINLEHEVFDRPGRH